MYINTVTLASTRLFQGAGNKGTAGRCAVFIHSTFTQNLPYPSPRKISVSGIHSTNYLGIFCRSYT